MTETRYRLSGWQLTTQFLLVSAGLSVVFFIPALYVAQYASTLTILSAIIVLIALIIVQAMLFRPIINQLTHITMTLDFLRRNETITEIAIADTSTLKPLIDVVNLMIQERHDLKTMRGQLVNQISVAAAQEERNRLARDLHDSIKQQVFSMSVSAAAAYVHLDNNLDASREALADVKRSAREALVEMRVMLQQLSPAPLEKSGLIQALSEQCEALSYRTGATVDTHFDAALSDEKLPAGTQEALFRIAQEALSNIARHARAGRVQLALNSDDNALVLSITDDGQGFDADGDMTGMGLSNIRSRTKDIGATVSITSQIGIGSELIVTVPFIQPMQKENTMQAQYESQIIPITTQYYRFAGGIAASIVAISLLLWRVLQRQDRIAEDGIMIVIMFALVTTLIIAPVIAVWSWLQSRSQHKALVMSAGRYSRVDYKVRRIQMMGNLGIAIACAWFLPILVLSIDITPWLPVAIGALFLIIALWCYLRMGNLYHQEVLLMDAESRIVELNEQITRMRKSWLSVIGLFAFIFITTLLLGDGIQIPPENPDHWMNLSIITISTLIVINQIVGIRTYAQWKQAAEQTKVSA